MSRAATEDFLVFHDEELRRRYANSKIPIATLVDAYAEGRVDLKVDIRTAIDKRDEFVNYRLTKDHFKWFLTNFIPEVTIHSKDQDKRIVREHYDRGNDFFEWFLGPRMVYTSGYYQDLEKDSLEQAQDQKMDLVCKKLDLQPGDRLLDIGCGWGTLVRYAAQHYGVDATGVTISKNQAEYGNQKIKEAGLQDRARILCLDYRDIPREKWNKISSLEMVEHVGVKNLVSFYELVKDRLTDDGLFHLQWTGLRRQMLKEPETLVWGLFMNRYIFPGADASLTPAGMLTAMEKAGWETFSVENISIHYARTIDQWLDNWLENRETVVQTYGEWWWRLWAFFLAWSVKIAEQGNAACFQVVLNKNLDTFDRTRWVRIPSVIHGRHAVRGAVETTDEPKQDRAAAPPAE